MQGFQCDVCKKFVEAPKKPYKTFLPMTRVGRKTIESEICTECGTELRRFIAETMMDYEGT